MFAVNTYEEIEKREKELNKKHIVVLLFVRPSLPNANDIINEFEYIHYNSGEYCSIYAVGYTNNCFLINADTKLNSAASKWSTNRSAALKDLGYGLHAMQDIEAHGNMGKGKAIPIQEFNADEIDFVWADSARVKVTKNATTKSRLVATRTSTYSYLDRFIAKIGGLSKLK